MDIVSSTLQPVGTQRPPPASSWPEAMRRAIRDPVQLCRVLGLPADYEPAAAAAAGQFPVFAPWSFVDRMRSGDPHDPLLRQVLPVAEELDEVPGFAADPLAEAAAMPRPGLVAKYPGRVLLITTGACAVHCRYCFRRHFPYQDAPHGIADWEPALQQIARDPTIDEVLLSGGDPLTRTDAQLAALGESLAAIPHLRRLRVHTRLPIMIPQRVTEGLLAWLGGSRLTPIVVVHANHPAELEGDVPAALGRLVERGVPVLNQAVLLRGVNDDAQVLEALCRRLVDLRVLPYYLHQLDRVAGAAHFEVPVARGRQLWAALQSRLPGYAVPRYVRETPGRSSKVWLA